MAPPKPTTTRLSDWQAMGYLYTGRRPLTDAQRAEVRRKRADLYERLRQLTVAEREQRR
jgi:hypothetical protein